MTTLERIIQPWIGCRYSHGVYRKYRWANCMRFACSVLDELLGLDESIPLPLLPQQTALHNRAAALRVIAQVRQRYPHDVVYDGGGSLPALIPADVLVTLGEANPGHLLLVGEEPCSAWHCVNGVGVQRTSIDWCLSCGIFRVFRPHGVPRD